MSDRSETILNERKDDLRRLRQEAPQDATLLCGYPGEGPPGYDRIYDPTRIRYVDVESRRVRERHPVPAGGPGRDAGTVLIVEPDVTLHIRRTTPADLLVGPILPRLERLAQATRCWLPRTRTPRHLPGSGWLDPDLFRAPGD